MKIRSIARYAGLVLVTILFLVVAVLPALPGAGALPVVFAVTAFQSLIFAMLGFVVLFVALGAVLIEVKKRKNATAASTSVVRSPSHPQLVGCTILALSCFIGSWLNSNSNALVGVSDIPAPASNQLRILSFNTDKAVPEAELLNLAVQTKPDIIVLPEQDQTFTSSFDCNFVPANETEHVGQLCEIGRQLDMNVYFWEDAAAQTLFVSNKLGEYQPINDETPPFAGFYAEPTNQASTSPKITVAHLQRPEFGIGTSWWRKHLNWAGAMCSEPRSIAVGDFNATNENIGSNHLGTCTDISSSLGYKPAGTWPSSLPAFWGAPIDHVYIGSAFQPLWFGTLADSYGSGHRPIFAIISE
ncbi:MAG: endonuclease/exonuclease/phosphatase family protein [Mobiluncus sp.]|uniref:endonuclease/exonuclease/phosphatase family protein n=1 Tax=Mobiluncus sp. TaxID=47293 RepID=UPI002590FF21|nr:endonuclease/exonuclease/phosphatase family protein [Mobiluncus sp.]MCI6585130.1 endonuclease/exonuclease/phosphatase family protein [Mobiluncus sp.]